MRSSRTNLNQTMDEIIRNINYLFHLALELGKIPFLEWKHMARMSLHDLTIGAYAVAKQLPQQSISHTQRESEHNAAKNDLIRKNKEISKLLKRKAQRIIKRKRQKVKMLLGE